MNLQVAFCFSSDIILDRVRSVSSSREVSVRQALTKPSHHLEYDHPDMEQVRFGPDPARRITRYIQDSYVNSTRCVSPADVQHLRGLADALAGPS